ncbi:protein Exd1 homolog isoform X2 [Zeugodacus cucurbitae]|uniref:Exonuclease 3'-5' domain-containing protein 1 n=1 Tax=Zeugodacus cucurbitae TaxID=28588 RepID=A0A0A1WK88_ZEUCU|nr:protein Exd1 homolog isoform X2 [Zeugodacus cucurbitae]
MEHLDITLQLGQMLLVQTASELLTGTLKYVDLNRKIIELDNPYDQRSNCQYNSPQILAFPQIQKLQIIRDDEPSSNSNSYSDTGTSATSSGSHTSYGTALKSPTSSPENKVLSTEESDVALSTTELELIHEQLNTVICITQTDQKYHKALVDIRVQPVVALVMEPVDYGRAQRTSVMVIATFQTVYIFDIIALGSIFREMKQLLEAERPRKVVHYSHKLVDHLMNRHGVKLGGIFDTFVAVSLVRGIKEPMTLIEAVENTLNITRLFFNPETEDNLHNNPYKRPLSLVARQVLAKKAVLQLKLHEHLLHKHMLKNFYNQCDIFSHTFCESEDATMPMEMQRKSRAGFQHIKRSTKDFEFKFSELMK